MNQGKTIAEWTTEIQRQSTLKRDFVTPTTDLTMVGNGSIQFKSTREIFTAKWLRE